MTRCRQRIGASAILGITASLVFSFRREGPSGRTSNPPAFLPPAAPVGASLAASQSLGGELPQLAMAEYTIKPFWAEDFEPPEWWPELFSDDASWDKGLFIILAGVFGWFFVSGYWATEGLREKLKVQGAIKKQKLKVIASEETSTPWDKYLVSRMYIKIKDMPAALAEIDEVEEYWMDMERALDEEDTMGALATRAMIHNSKGYALTQLEPPRTSAARKEFVRAVTFWPEFPEALLNISRELNKRKRYNVAIRTLKTALKWQPENFRLKEEIDYSKNMLERAEDIATEAKRKI